VTPEPGRGKPRGLHSLARFLAEPEIRPAAACRLRRSVTGPRSVVVRLMLMVMVMVHGACGCNRGWLYRCSSWQLHGNSKLNLKPPTPR
jgi:hypothetical protein